MGKRVFNPYFFVVIGVLAVSSSSLFVKLSTAPAGVIAFYRLFFSVLIILPWFLRNHLYEIREISNRDLLLSAIAGIFLAFHFIFWFESLNYTSVASSTVLVTLQPLFAFFGTYLFFHEKIPLRTGISAAMAIIGSVLISWGDFYLSPQAFFGDVLALFACALITAYLLFGQSVRKRVSAMAYTFLLYSISSLTLLIYVLIKKEPLFPYPPSDWGCFLLLAILPTLMGHSLFNLALKWVSTNIISMAILFEPVGATVLAYLFLHESVAWNQWLGGLVVLIGLGLFSLPGREEGKHNLASKTKRL